VNEIRVSWQHRLHFPEKGEVPIENCSIYAQISPNVDMEKFSEEVFRQRERSPHSSVLARSP